MQDLRDPHASNTCFRHPDRFNVADISRFYGSFGLFFALVFWVYYSCIVFILGAEMGWVWRSRSPGGEGHEASF